MGIIEKIYDATMTLAKDHGWPVTFEASLSTSVYRKYQEELGKFSIRHSDPPYPGGVVVDILNTDAGQVTIMERPELADDHVYVEVVTN